MWPSKRGGVRNARVLRADTERMGRGCGVSWVGEGGG